jgi:hypothetical protein
LAKSKASLSREKGTQVASWQDSNADKPLTDKGNEQSHKTSLQEVTVINAEATTSMIKIEESLSISIAERSRNGSWKEILCSP